MKTTFYYQSFIGKTIFGPAEQGRIIANMAATLGLTAKHVQKNVLKNIIYNISKEFGDKLKAALNSK